MEEAEPTWSEMTVLNNTFVLPIRNETILTQNKQDL